MMRKNFLILKISDFASLTCEGIWNNICLININLKTQTLTSDKHSFKFLCNFLLTKLSKFLSEFWLLHLSYGNNTRYLGHDRITSLSPYMALNVTLYFIILTPLFIYFTYFLFCFLNYKFITFNFKRNIHKKFK